MTMSFMPRPTTASFIRVAGLFGGKPPDRLMTGLSPTSTHASADSKGGWPADQLPCAACAIWDPGLSIVFDEKIIGDPIACIHPMATEGSGQNAAMPVPK